MPLYQEEAFHKRFHSELSILGGIGVKRAEAFLRMGIGSVGELLYHMPRAYQNRGHIRLLSEGVLGESCSYLLTIGTAPRSATLKNRKVITKFRAFDESGTVEICYFNARYIESCFEVGLTYRFWGKLTRTKSGALMMSAPIHENASDGTALPDFTPIYPSVKGLTQGVIAEAVGQALNSFELCGMPELLPKKLREELYLPERKGALEALHRPTCREDIEAGRRYLAAEESYLFALALVATRHRKRQGTPPPMKRQVSEEPLIRRLGFSLTTAQKRSIDEIRRDMLEGDLPMNRLLSGDVGSGKTAVAAAALYFALQNDRQAALMAPTEILATQHYHSIAPLFEELGFRVGLLVGSLTASQKKTLRKKIADGEIDLVIGTHALLTETTVFDRLGLVVTDEQHRFGVAQRAELGHTDREGYTPHVLVMSATPIPRTLALILYGDLSLSVLDELPPGRQRVDTFVVDDSYRARLNAFIDKQVKEGGQVYIVCPSIERREEEEEGDLLRFAPDGSVEMNLESPGLVSATDLRDHLANEVFPQYEVGLIHGKMKGREKDEVMRRFERGELPILVSTTVIEVGVNVPNASLMIVENAERFGLAQLHQLRGRVGRGKRKAYCVLVSSSKAETARERLAVMKTTYDGYRIAEHDLKLRGPGDYFPSKNGGARQHGSGGMALCLDMPLLKKAIKAAEQTLETDPALEERDNRYACEAMRRRVYMNERAMQ